MSACRCEQAYRVCWQRQKCLIDSSVKDYGGHLSALHWRKQSLDSCILIVPIISHSSCKLQAGWCKEAKRKGANMRYDLALQLDLELGMVTIGVGEIPSGRMICNWGSKKELAWLMDQRWAQAEPCMELKRKQRDKVDEHIYKQKMKLSCFCCGMVWHFRE